MSIDVLDLCDLGEFMWQPINLDNSIEVMAVAVTFSEPIGSVAFRRIARELETTTRNAGLNNRQPLQTVDIIMGPGNVPVQQTQSNGVSYMKHSLHRSANGPVENRLVEQLQFVPNQMALQSWKYTGWTAFKAAFLDMIGPAFEEASKSAPVKSFRIEYRDRFVFDGDAGHAHASDLVPPECRYIAAHVFERDSLWHSHTGWFELFEGGKKLFQANFDFAEVVSSPALVAAKGKRTMGIFTVVEIQYSGGSKVVEQDARDYLSTTMDDLHTGSMMLLKEVVNKDMLIRIGVKDRVH